LLLDPVNFGYYWIAPQLVVLLAAGNLARGRGRLGPLALAGCYPLCAGGVFGELSALGVALASIAAAALWCAIHPAPGQPLPVQEHAHGPDGQPVTWATAC
jgi:hypothetical protein